MKPSKLQPALLGGAVSGVLSGLPFVSAGNLCCCLWVIAGGVVAAYLLQQKDLRPITAGDGAVVGLLAGIFSAVISTLISIPINMMTGPMNQRFMQQILESSGDMPPQFREILESIQAGGAAGIGVMFFFFFVFLVVAMIFSTIGGLLGAVIFQKKVPPSTGEVLPPA